MTSELDRGVYYAKYYGRGGGGCQVAAGCKKNVQGKQTCQKNNDFANSLHMNIDMSSY